MMENAIDAGATYGEGQLPRRRQGPDPDRRRRLRHVAHRRAHGLRPPRHEQDRPPWTIFTPCNTFGFRGEALASIAAVAQVELRTRQAGDEVGTQTEINGGQFAGADPGDVSRGFAVLRAQPFLQRRRPAAVFWTRAPPRRRRSSRSSSASRSATRRSPSSSTPTTPPVYTLQARRRSPDASSTWWGVTSSRTCWRSRPTLRSPASRDISAVRLPPRQRNTRAIPFCQRALFQEHLSDERHSESLREADSRELLSPPISST